MQTFKRRALAPYAIPSGPARPAPSSSPATPTQPTRFLTLTYLGLATRFPLVFHLGIPVTVLRLGFMCGQARGRESLLWCSRSAFPRLTPTFVYIWLLLEGTDGVLACVPEASCVVSPPVPEAKTVGRYLTLLSCPICLDFPILGIHNHDDGLLTTYYMPDTTRCFKNFHLILTVTLMTTEQLLIVPFYKWESIRR